ncbi:polysaccharide deacetylase family protein [Carnobacterium viridans]|uniref:Peptidoglycan/xylan/chitin deacetylase, PgdA/CDA1 family n=1 Tax=Carnobacterium viridans TaxID=174587 RepID=A0A1H0Y306_9LACT|nr:polysaccharide deacetylase family protein [Carnobacterium viridans]UDE95378.1 polysaccharide deacetylase family protein [Carnobacterium viridans]SDQ09475.1 Peptidoglycan/xylan/chitin deacetylase, PgdA/CDA1 family [Carnobacterium viridans]
MKTILLGVSLMSALILSGCQTSDPSADNSSTSSLASNTSESQSSSTEESFTSEESSEVQSSVESSDKQEAFRYHINPTTSVVEPNDEATDSKVALLTFDDSPDQHAVEIAEQLKAINAPAIFFVNGMYIESDEGKAKLKQIYDMGFEIGNHTQTHPNLSTISSEEQREEILQTNQLIYEVTGEKPRFFRAPHGVTTETSDAVIAQEDMVSMNWTYGYDWEADYQTSEALSDIMLNTEYLNNGANLLMHDRSWTNEAVISIAEGLIEKGYTLVDPNLIESPEREE